MRKALFMALTAVMAAGAITGADAQEKGKFWVGGQFGFSTAKSNGVSMDTFTIAPEFGYNFSDRWGAGIEFGLQNGNINNGSTSQVGAHAISVSPFARYTFLHWRALSLHADGGFVYSYANGKIDAEGDYIGGKTQYGGLFVNPGFELHLTRCLGLSGSVNLFSLGTGSIGDGTHSGDATTWSASLNSPFTPGAMQVGFRVSF